MRAASPDRFASGAQASGGVCGALARKAVEEAGDRRVEEGADLHQLGGADAIGAAFVLLHLLEAVSPIALASSAWDRPPRLAQLADRRGRTQASTGCGGAAARVAKCGEDRTPMSTPAVACERPEATRPRPRPVIGEFRSLP